MGSETPFDFASWLYENTQATVFAAPVIKFVMQVGYV